MTIKVGSTILFHTFGSHLNDVLLCSRIPRIVFDFSSRMKHPQGNGIPRKDIQIYLQKLVKGHHEILSLIIQSQPDTKK